jgi:hypothetical protein
MLKKVYRFMIVSLIFSVGLPGFGTKAIAQQWNNGKNDAFGQEEVFREQQKEGRKVILYLNAMDVHVEENPQSYRSNADWKFGDPVQDFLDFKNRMHKKFPHRPIRSVISNNSVDFKHQLDRVLLSGDEISHMYWMGHGNSSTERDSFGRLLVSMVLAIGRTQVKINAVDLNSDRAGRADRYEPDNPDNPDNEDALRLFSGIRGRFCAGALVLFECCNLFMQPNAKIQLSTELAKVLGLKDGYVYGNHYHGSEIPTFKRFVWNERRADRREERFWRQVRFALLVAAAVNSVRNLFLEGKDSWRRVHNHINGVFSEQTERRFETVAPRVASVLLTEGIHLKNRVVNVQNAVGAISLGFITYYFRTNYGYIFAIKEGKAKSYINSTAFKFKGLFFKQQKIALPKV